MTVGLHISVRAGPTISSANLAIHYDTSDHEEPTRPAPPTTTTTTTETSNATGTTTTAATTTAAPTTAAPTTASVGTNPAPRLYTSSTGTDDDNPITSYEKIIVQQVLQLKTTFFFILLDFVDCSGKLSACLSFCRGWLISMLPHNWQRRCSLQFIYFIYFIFSSELISSLFFLSR